MRTMQEWEEIVLAAIDQSAGELLDLAGLLIRTPSENPPGDCTEVARVIMAQLQDDAGNTQCFNPGLGRVSIVAHHGKSDTRRHLVFAGHTDVVPAGDDSRWTFSPLSGEIVDGYLRGRGASDMKAGLAGVIHVFLLLQRLRVPLAGKLSLMAVPDEEMGGSYGADWLLDQGVLDGATGAVIAEPAERTHPTIGQKGSNWFRMTIRGEPGHGSLQPLRGVNANLLAARAILAIQKLWEMKPSPPDDLKELIEASKTYADSHDGNGSGLGAVFDHVTVNIGTIHGGSSTNVVADTCVVEVDTRIPVGLSRVEVLSRVRELLKDAGLEAEIEAFGFSSEANWTLPTDPVVEELVTALRDLSTLEATGVLQWASSDARTFRSHGIPAIQYGPAELASIHGLDERAPVEAVILAAKVYALTAIRYLGLAG